MPSPTSDRKTCAVVATYNRKETLVDCLDALVSVTGLDAVIVVDGYSTDGTGAYLYEEGFVDQTPPEDGTGHWETTSTVEDIDLTYMRYFEDFGGAGSFHHGMKQAYHDGHDDVWVMDDDVEPTEDALATLQDRAKTLRADGVKLGFVCSKVMHTDGSVHRMNVPEIQSKYDEETFNSHDDEGVVRVRSCSFVSALISREGIEDCGLPLKEFFIYSDDVEFTRRLTDSGYAGFYVPDSVVYHHTPNNTGVDIYSDDSTMKHYYSTRNGLYLTRSESWQKYVALLCHHLLYRTVAVYIRREDQKRAFAETNLRGALDSILFDPTVEYP